MQIAFFILNLVRPVGAHSAVLCATAAARKSGYTTELHVLFLLPNQHAVEDLITSFVFQSYTKEVCMLQRTQSKEIIL